MYNTYIFCVKGVATIENLLEQAKDEIPQEYWSQTPLILRATAGLRLLPAAKAENLLNSVKALFKRMPFLTNENSVEIMDGTDEGIMSWFTVNFLSGKNIDIEKRVYFTCLNIIYIIFLNIFICTNVSVCYLFNCTFS